MTTPASKRPEPASRAVQAEWLRRVEAEYRSAATTHHLTLWLMQLGAPPALLRAGLRIVADELAHAAASHRVYTRAGGREALQLVQETLGLTRSCETLEEDVARIVLDVFCLGETVAVPLFRGLREGATVTVARRALDRILRDEVRHRDFGWTVLPWMLGEPRYEERVRAVVERELARGFARVRGAYGASASASTFAEPDRAWGLMEVARYREAVDRTLHRDWIPRFAEVGIDAAQAWSRALASAGPERTSFEGDADGAAETGRFRI